MLKQAISKKQTTALSAILIPWKVAETGIAET